VSRILIVYYSRTGYTRKLAREIASAMDADVEPVDDGRDRSGPLGYLRSAIEAGKKKTIDILPPAYDPTRYDLVVLGTPVWVGSLCSPLRSYMAAHKTQLPRVAFFCTQGGSGAQKAFRDMEKLCGQAPVASLAVSDSQLNANTYRSELEGFVRTLTAAANDVSCGANDVMTA
jgi:flavodoxin